jgi:hypothetical protein
MTNILQKFKVYDLQDFDNQQFLDFCRRESTNSSDPAASNMWSDHWTTDTHTLPHLVYIQKRFDDSCGQFNLLLADNEIIGCAGVYISEFCNSLAIAGCRTWISKTFRNMMLVRDYLLPVQKIWARKRQLQAIGLSFNSYNRNLIKIWEKRRLGEHRPARQSHHLFYTGLHKIEFPVMIQNTPQWIIYEKIDDTWNFDWELIKCK